jgi:hypothetical protein
MFKTIPLQWAPKYVRLGMSLAGNCKQVDVFRRRVSDNMKREYNELDEDFFCEAFNHTWSGKLGIRSTSQI